MYRVLDETSSHTVGIKVDGKLTKDDYGVLIPYFENRICESGPLSLLCDMTQFTGIEIEAFWEDFTFSIHHLHDFRRIAIVGDQRWLDWYTKIFNHLVKTELRYFQQEQIDEAWRWVKSQAL
ncbi:STAS/SEC14 domain-containing protein [Nitrospira sp. M1]